MTRIALLSLHTSPLMLAGLGDAGGMNVYIRELSSALARTGLDITIFVRRWSHEVAPVVDVKPGVRVMHVTAGPVGLAKEALPAVVDEFVDGVRDCLVENPVDVLHANYWLSGLAGHRLKHEFGLPLVSTFHTLALVKASVESSELVEASVESFESVHRAKSEKEVMSCSDVITANSVVEAQQLSGLYGVDPSIIEVVQPGVSREFFKVGNRSIARIALGLDDKEPMLLFVGRIQPLKGVCLAVKTLHELSGDYPKARLFIVGGASGLDGQQEFQKLQDTIVDYELEDRVKLISPKSHHKLATYFQAANVCLVPSRSESFGLVALEAAACGTPVVAANVGGLSSIVKHGRTGFLVSERSPAAYAKATRTILSNPYVAVDMGSQAAQLASLYTWSTMADKFSRIIKHLKSHTRLRTREKYLV